MAINQANIGVPRNITSTTLLCTVGTGMLGVFCSTTSSGTIQFYDSSTAATNNAITGAITLTAGTFYPIPVATSNGLYAVIGSTANVTVVTL